MLSDRSRDNIGFASLGILAAADECKADLIVVGSHGRSVIAMVFS